ncbi:MAG: hypothetical protein ACREFP_10835 [Acetobacteraceae bacterium]
MIKTPVSREGLLVAARGDPWFLALPGTRFCLRGGIDRGGVGEKGSEA